MLVALMTSELMAKELVEPGVDELRRELLCLSMNLSANHVVMNLSRFNRFLIVPFLLAQSVEVAKLCVAWDVLPFTSRVVAGI